MFIQFKTKFMIFITICSIFLFLIPNTNSAFAASGWQYVGNSYIELNGTYVGRSVPVNSHGGNFKATFTGYPGQLSVTLYEDDPNGNPDDLVEKARTVSGNGGELIWKNIDAVKDGDNNIAELYIRVTPKNTSNAKGKITVKFYD
ncbi:MULTISPECIES: hypothetical protein [Niallia]|uniref:hypothetical protein n=1 Tax=Niallia TaxID=2837506 RepID=UPI001EDB0973|nr:MULTISPECIES: hypothetical protein [Niallia]MED4041002.1 hypothetical protein [Niallia taxi]UPO90980.1 hypothetical protein L8T27_026960 [Niallia sp. Man26]